MPVYAYVFSLDLYASPSTSRRRDDLFLPTRTGTMRSSRRGANAVIHNLLPGIAHSRGRPCPRRRRPRQKRPPPRGAKFLAEAVIYEARQRVRTQKKPSGGPG